jgi:hypothetical protein
MYIFPQSGPHLLMALKMLADLYNFLLLMLFIIIPFAFSSTPPPTYGTPPGHLFASVGVRNLSD